MEINYLILCYLLVNIRIKNLIPKKASDYVCLFSEYPLLVHDKRKRAFHLERAKAARIIRNVINFSMNTMISTADNDPECGSFIKN